MRLLVAVLFASMAFAQQPVTVQQGGNSATVSAGGALKVDASATTQPVSGTVAVSGSVAVTGTFWQTTQPVSIASLPVLSAGSNIIGKVGIDQTTPGTTNGVVVNNSSIAVTGTFWQSTQPVSLSSLPALATGANTIGNVNVNGTVPVSGTFWQATQPVSGTFWQATQPVSGTVTANAGTGTFAVSADPCFANSKSFAVINLTANTQVITGTSAKKTYICSLNLVAGAATNVAVVEGTGTTCATGIAGMAGGSTAATGWNFAANGGIALGNGGGSVMITATNADNVCVLVSAANQISGTIAYVQQ